MKNTLLVISRFLPAYILSDILFGCLRGIKAPRCGAFQGDWQERHSQVGDPRFRQTGCGAPVPLFVTTVSELQSREYRLVFIRQSDTLLFFSINGRSIMGTKAKWFRCLGCQYVTAWDTDADSKPCTMCGGLMIHVSEKDVAVQAFLSNEYGRIF